MVFKANRKIDQNHETTVSLLLLISLAMPVASNNDSLDVTNLSVASSLLTTRYCGHVLIAVNESYSETIKISAKIRNSSATKDSTNFMRNADIKILKRVRIQLKIARNHFRNNREVIARLYTDVKTVMQTDYHYDWLPPQPLYWYKEHVIKLDEDKKVFTLLPVLRDSLHNFSVTLRQMRQFNETHYTSNYTLRKMILNDLSKHLIAVLCEVETALMSLSSRHDRRLQQRTDGGGTEGAAVVGGPGWDPHPDRTTMLIQDWGVLTIYYRFLKDWLHISREMVRDQRRPQWAGNDSGDDATAAVVAGPSERRQLLLPCIRHRSGGGSSSAKYKRRRTHVRPV